MWMFKSQTTRQFMAITQIMLAPAPVVFVRIDPIRFLVTKPGLSWFLGLVVWMLMFIFWFIVFILCLWV